MKNTLAPIVFTLFVLGITSGCASYEVADQNRMARLGQTSTSPAPAADTGAVVAEDKLTLDASPNTGADDVGMVTD